MPLREDLIRDFLLCRLGLSLLLCAATANAVRASDESTGASPSQSSVSIERPCQGEAAPSQATIGKIEIDNQKIFDLNDSRENAWPYRLANRLHINSKPATIAQQLLFKSGERYAPRLILESERILRSNRYLHDAKITPIACRDGKIDLKVTTRDVWSLDPGVSFSRSGGQNSTGIQLQEVNLLGYGSSLNLSKKSGVDRDTVLVGYSDRSLFGTWIALDTNYARNSDGSNKTLALTRPFVGLDGRWAAGVSAGDDDRVDSLYRRGEAVDKFHHRQRRSQVFGGRSAGLVDGWTRRWTMGLIYDDNRFGPESGAAPPRVLPPDRKFVYPFVRMDLIEDEYQVRQNYNQIGRTEDFYLGRQLGLQLGYASTALDSSENALIYEAQVGQGFDIGSTQSILLSTGLSGRLAGTSGENRVLSASARYYWRQSPRHLWYASALADIGHNLDIDNQLLLGGDNGLRGYPLRFQTGDKRALFTFEHRYFSDWYPLRLFRVGGAVFFDVGRAWGANSVGAQDQGWLKDFGVGLRLGNTRSGLRNVIHVDVAFPLDRDNSIKRRQFVVEAKRSF